HNLETVERLTKKVRDGRCDYRMSLAVLDKIKKLNPKVFTKSSLMLGLGETPSEVLCSMDDLRAVSVDVLTLGQYLRPTDWHLPVHEFIHPTVFKELEDAGMKKGFLCVPSGPLVRSSYRAGEKFLEGLIRAGKKLEA
ncbi:MAG: lipoyl synthase, partial [Proteobacteria bacterium]|nr:lipoyl synthase [Pseudomonadota bacterium]